MMSLIAHYESVLGPYRASVNWDEGRNPGFEVVQFADEPRWGGVTYATVGLSRNPLRSAVPGTDMRQELLMTVSTVPDPNNIATLLAQVGREALESGRGVPRGTVIGPYGPLFPDSEMEALYVAAPAYLPEGFETVRSQSGDIFVAWMVPISHREAHFAQEKGWRAFERLLSSSDAFLTDPFRRGLDIPR